MIVISKRISSKVFVFINLLAVIVLNARAQPQQTPSSTTAESQPNEPAAVRPIPGSTTRLELATWRGKSLHHAMTTKGGIIEKITADASATLKLAKPEVVVSTLETSFFPKVVRKVNRFAGDDLPGVVRGLRAKQCRLGCSSTDLRKHGVHRDVANAILLASGGGVLIDLDEDNYFYNVSYAPGELRPGRSFGVGPLRKLDDTTYPDYLEWLDKYFENSTEEEFRLFYRVLAEILVYSDARNLDRLQAAGENLVTNFVLIYVAEAYRHQTGGFRPFHRDLTETTLVSAWTAASRIVPETVTKPYSLKKGEPSDYNICGKGGCGLGFARHRRRLQDALCTALKKLNPSFAQRLFGLIPDSQKHDCIQTMAWFVDSERNAVKLATNGDSYRDSFVELAVFLHRHAADIRATIPEASTTH